MRAVVIKELGDIDVVKVEENWAEPAAAAGELLVDVEFAGVNFMDTAACSWGAPHGQLPLIPGVEGAGTVAALGEGVTDFEVGDRVAWVSVWGSYAERLAVPAVHAVPLPNYIPTDVAAATMMQGLTSHHFANEVAPLGEGQTALVHAAAGGVGRMLSQQLKLRGARVIGLVSREEKVSAAKAAGADEVLISTGGDFVDRVKDLTDGEGVDAVFDGGGESTFRPSLDALRVAGAHVWYGPLIGDIPTVSLFELPKSIRLSYAVYSDHIRTRDLLLEHSNDLFDKIRDERLRIDISRRYPLSEAKQAHIDITSRGTTGKLLLDTSL
jgi:NADPH:quinone reductase-like Zn-dependent oxidoreductase